MMDWRELGCVVALSFSSNLPMNADGGTLQFATNFLPFVFERYDCSTCVVGVGCLGHGCGVVLPYGGSIAE
ncbi:hypothetical protein RISK_003428 [Rhodopirellula islandica]|uniref:Uncharacterized protein n=1 Tax=Rhodopirellula islandica TaxID=595434 RepID=A0A0J1EFT9_RHOIS|nr:hypothetical protein RISK_003428 [Rhodopirellula islandica]